MSRRRRLFAAAALLLLVALVGHYLWWYQPRPHPAVPEPGGLSARLLAEGELPVALWIPYPHQNLGALEASFGEGEERQRFLDALARVAGLPEPALPGFGPFTAPPSREMVALSDEAGERVLVAARVYPALAALARLAGTLAGNPWLAGGEVEAFGGRAEVTWDGTLWTAGTVSLESLLPRAEGGGAAAATAATDDGGDGEPALAELRLERAVSYLPAGRHRLRDTGDGLEVAALEVGRAGESAAEVAEPPRLAVSDTPPAFLAVAGPGGPLAGAGGAFGLFPGESSGGLAGLLGGLPRAVVWYHPGDDRFELPGEEILRSLGRDARVGGWTLLGTSSSAVAAATPLTPEVDRLSRAASLALAADPRATLAAVDKVLDVLDSVPLVDRDELRRWRDWHTVLTPLTGYDGLWLIAPPGEGAAGGGFRLVLAEAGTATPE